MADHAKQNGLGLLEEAAKKTGRNLPFVPFVLFLLSELGWAVEEALYNERRDHADTMGLPVPTEEFSLEIIPSEKDQAVHEHRHNHYFGLELGPETTAVLHSALGIVLLGVFVAASVVGWRHALNAFQKTESSVAPLSKRFLDVVIAGWRAVSIPAIIAVGSVALVFAGMSFIMPEVALDQTESQEQLVGLVLVLSFIFVFSWFAAPRFVAMPLALTADKDPVGVSKNLMRPHRMVGFLCLALPALLTIPLLGFAPNGVFQQLFYASVSAAISAYTLHLTATASLIFWREMTMQHEPAKS